jgi:hypothetical protein
MIESIQRRAFVQGMGVMGLSMLASDKGLTLGRSLPPFPTTEDMYGWARDVVDITNRHKQYRRSGTAGDAAVRQYIAEQLKSFGVPTVEDQTYTFAAHFYDSWSLEVAGKEIPCFFWRDSAFTPQEGLTAELVYVGDSIPRDGTLKGKIAVLDVTPGAIHTAQLASVSDYVHDPAGFFDEPKSLSAPNLSTNMPAAFYQAHSEGAVGLVGILDFATGTNKFYPDVGLAVRDLMPALMVGKFDGEALKQKLGTGGPTVGRIKLLGRADKRATSGNVVGTLPGVTDDVLIINTHHDGCFASAVEDASGIASVLALAKFYGAYVPDLRVRTLVFDFEGNHWSWNYPLGSREFARRNPDILDRTVAVFGIEHIAREMKVEDGKYVDAGYPSPSILFTPDNAQLKQLAIEAVKKNNLDYTLIPRFGGEDLLIPAQTRWFHLQGLPVYQYISGPEYLYLADDTLDKIDKERFATVNRTFIDLIERFQYIPRQRTRGR